MNDPAPDATCSDCGESLDGEEADPCPSCGSPRRTAHLSGVSAGTSSMSATVTVTRIREFVDRHPGWMALGVGATVGGIIVGPLVGPVWGVVAGVASAAVSHIASRRGETTVREIERR